MSTGLLTFRHHKEMTSTSPMNSDDPNPPLPRTDGTNPGRVLASWSRAVILFKAQLTKDERKKINAADLEGVFSDLLYSANSVRDKVESGRYPWTPCLRRVIDQVNRYAVVGDIIIQHHTEYLALVWGTVRFLLLFAAEESKVSEQISTGLHTVTQAVFRVEEYAKLFSTPANSTTDRVFDSLQENLTFLYAEVLSFLVRSTLFFQKRSIHRFISAGLSSDTKFQAILDKINSYERTVEKDKNLLETEARKKNEEYDNGIWLQATDFAMDLKKRKDEHFQDTCKWFFHRNEYMRFKGVLQQSQDQGKTQTRYLWISGKPGCGKSVLAAQIIKDLSTPENIVTYVFCKTGVGKRNTLNAILRNLLFQLIHAGARPSWHRLLLSIRQAAQKESVECTEQLWTALEQILRDRDKHVFILDAIDECDCSKSERQEFVSRLTKAFRLNPNAQIISTSQLELPALEPLSEMWSTLRIQTADVEADIRLFTEIKLNNSEILSSHPEKARLLDTIVASSDGMILWANLMIGELEVRHWGVAKVLQEPPRGLSLLYETIMRRIFAEKRTLDRNRLAFEAVLVAIRPLRHEELAMIVAVSEGLESHYEYDTCGRPQCEASQILEDCSPLLTSLPDGTIQLVHSSLKQVLFSDPALIIDGHIFREDLIHSQMASILLTYMSFPCFADKFDDHTEPSFYLVEYGSKFLLEHCVKTSDSKVAEKLLSFLMLTQGWTWVDRLIYTYEVTIGHLQVWQSRLCVHIQQVASEKGSVLSNFLEATALKRLADLQDLPEENSARLRAASHLATIYIEAGRWDEAAELSVQILETRKRVLGDEHPDTLAIMSSLAVTYLVLGRVKESEKLDTQVMTIRKRVLGEEHPSTLTSMSKLAATYWNQGRLKESEELDMQAMTIRKRVLGNEHPDTLASMSSLAITYLGLGRWEESEELGLQVMTVSKRVLGDEHPSTLTSMSNLAATYWNQGRLKESEELDTRAMTIRKYVLGNEHPDTLASISNLAITYENHGHWKKSEELGTQVMTVNKRVLGDKHPSTLNSMSNLAITYRSQGRWKESEELCTQVMMVSKRVLGDDNLRTLISMSNLALTFMSQRRMEEAEKLGCQVIEMKTRILGGEHPNTLTSRHNLAHVYHASNRRQSAVNLMRDVISLREKVIGKDNPETVGSKRDLELWLEDNCSESVHGV